MLNKKLKALLNSLILAFLATLFILGLSSPNTPLVKHIHIDELIEEAEQVFYDICWKIKFRLMYEDVDKEANVHRLDYKENRIILVDIDETSLDHLGEYGDWPRTHHGDVVEELGNQGAAAISFDILFKDANFGEYKTQQQINTLNTLFPGNDWEQHKDAFRNVLNEDSIFVKKVKDNGSVIVAATVSPEKSYFFQADRYPLGTEKRRLETNPASGFLSDWGPKSLDKPLLDNIFPELAQAGNRMGLVNVISDPDGVHRREPLFYRFPTKKYDSTAIPHLYPILSLQTVLFVMGQSPSNIKIEDDYVDIGKPLGLFLDSNNQLQTTYPQLTGSMLEEVVAKQNTLKKIGPLASDVPLINLTPAIKAFIEDDEPYIDILHGQTLEGDLLEYVLNTSSFDEFYFSYDKTAAEEVEINEQFQLYYDDEEDIVYLEDLENEEEIYFDKYTLKTLRANSKLLSDIPSNKTSYLSGTLDFRWNYEYNHLSSSYIILNPDVLDELFTYNLKSLHKKLNSIPKGDTLRLGKNIKIPIDGQGNVLINYRGKYQTPSNQKTFRTISYTKLLKKQIQTTNDGAIFVLGSSAAALFDQVAAPDEKVYPGVYIHMNLMENFLNNRFITLAPYTTKLLIAFLFAFLISWLVLNIGPLWSSVIVVIGGFSYFVFVAIEFQEGMYWGVIIPELTLIVGFLFATMLRYLAEEREKRRIKDNFKQYISPEQIDIMLASGKMPELGGVEEHLTAYFTDIASFSTFSEKIGSAEKLVELLNEYLTDMTDILTYHKGTLDKYEGDAIIAFFGAPVHLKNHALNACKSALSMQRKLGDLRVHWEQQGDKWPTIVHHMRMRIGLNSGNIVHGNMGSTMRKNYTMMGDSVNLAARLESGAKQYGVFTMASEATLNNAGRSEFYYRHIDTIKVVGKNEPVNTYELLGLIEDKNLDYEQLIRLFNEAKEFYKSQQWDEAIEAFEACLDFEPFHPDRELGCKTTPSHVFIERCKGYKLNSPVPKGQDWDGVYVANEK